MFKNWNWTFPALPYFTLTLRFVSYVLVRIVYIICQEKVLAKCFVRNNHNYNLRSQSELLLPNANIVFKGQNSISYFGLVIRNSIAFELRKASSYQTFTSELKWWRPTNRPCRLCKKLHRKLRIYQYIFLVRQICSWLYILFNSRIYTFCQFGVNSAGL